SGGWAAPKLAVWRDAYYVGAEHFATPNSDPKPIVMALERDQMLTGSWARMQFCEVSSISNAAILPATLEGSTPPPPGEPETFASIGDTNINHNSLYLWLFSLQWGHPEASTFTQQPALTTNFFNQIKCNGSAICIPQPGIFQFLDSQSQVLMPRVVYRNFGDH